MPAQHLPSNSSHSSLPWYRGLWWSIWLTIFASVLIYGIGTAAYFRFIIEPELEAQRLVIEQERDDYLRDFRTYLSEQTSNYHQELETWKLSPAGTPVPPFNYHERARVFREGRDDTPVNASQNKPNNPVNPWLWFALMIFLMGVATYPLARKLTRRLEKLQQGVEHLGTGNLNTRVEVSGHDEIARLAQSFNASAKRIELLVQQHKDLLAHVSHELRTPLARLRMSAELAALNVPEIAADLKTDIKELDALVEEVLLASRLDAATDLLNTSSFDAFALAAEEAARTNAILYGQSVEMQADETLVRRAIRNVLTNAQRYASNSEVSISISLEKTGDFASDMVCFTITDHGPGLSEEERKNIFTPFFRAKSTSALANGTGLGLALVYQITNRHGGKATCLPQTQGTGCIFELRFPQKR